MYLHVFILHIICRMLFLTSVQRNTQMIIQNIKGCMTDGGLGIAVQRFYIRILFCLPQNTFIGNM